MPVYLIYPLAFMVGVAFNLNPSCGTATMIWSSTQSKERLWLFASIRIFVLSLVGAAASLLGETIRRPWGILMLGAAAYLLYTTIQQAKSGQSGACSLPPKSGTLPLLLALTPPPSGYIGLAFFFGGFTPPTPLVGALTLFCVGLGLTLPLWLMAFKPEYGIAWQNLLTNNPKWFRTKMVFQYLGVIILTAVGLAFIFVQGFHRPLLEMLQ
jgi:hypothetical protein